MVTFTMPDPSSINPFGRRFRNRMFHFNDIIREEVERYGVLVMDFQHYPIIQDPRLFSEDRLHGNELGHERVAAAMAWRLGIEGADESWAEPFPEAPPRLRTREQLAADVEWARRYFAPWLGRASGGSRRARTYREAAGANPCAQTSVVSRACKVRRSRVSKDLRKRDGIRTEDWGDSRYLQS